MTKSQVGDQVEAGNARAQLDAACADISSIVGASSDYNRIRKLSIGIIEARRLLDDNYHESTQGASAAVGRQWALDHTPKTAKNAAHGCALAMMLFALVFTGCGDDVQTRPDASPKYDACDPTISKGCVPEDAGKIVISDARSCPLDSGMCEPTCEALGCMWSEYAPTCSHKLECVCNNQTCQGTAP